MHKPTTPCKYCSVLIEIGKWMPHDSEEARQHHECVSRQRKTEEEAAQAAAMDDIPEEEFGDPC